METFGLQGRDLLRNREVAKLDLDTGPPLAEDPDDCRAAGEIGPERGAHEQLTDLPAAGAPHHGGGALGLRNDRFRLAQKYSTGSCQLHATLRPVQESRLELPFETTDLLTQRGLGNGQ